MWHNFVRKINLETTIIHVEQSNKNARYLSLILDTYIKYVLNIFMRIQT